MPGTSIYEFTGAMINTGQSPPSDGPTAGGPKDGDPVDLGTGLFVYEKTDLYLPDVIPLALTRTYRPNDAANRPFGIGTTHPYAMFLWSAQQYPEADLVLPDGGRAACRGGSIRQGESSRLARHPFSQIASVTDPLNHTTSFTYDSKGNLLTITDPLNKQTPRSRTTRRGKS